ncbi:hypothetical protein CKM354_001128400 [Cercospora kikuchii]|uniref:Ecp2 effector protein-like domain-containing protein n=1 Tax=Cercospora kikuchii TaxID=84275 RepID=A0A9P3CWS1_9PEZI|nr:uncharacterized protein CKM354_001128400 [Cercospora kikuchii]GIZ48215.1 hypothetical protein CKM354_001128400 [Cercospora kikuchii]
MQFSTALTALAGLLAYSSIAAASPLAEPQNAGSGNSPSNRCNTRAVTGNQVVKGTAPTWNDCYTLADKFQNEEFFKKSIKVEGNYKKTYGTCGFSITAKAGNFQLGKDDVADLIRSTAGDLGAKSGAYQTGLVPCDTPGTAGGDRGRQTGWTIGNLSAPGPKQG